MIMKDGNILIVGSVEIDVVKFLVSNMGMCDDILIILN